MTEAKSHHIELRILPGHIGDESLCLRVTPAFRDDLVQSLDEHGLAHGEVLEFSAGSELAVRAVYAVTSSAGLAALTSALKAFLSRHSDKSVTLADGTTIKGYSEAEVSRVLRDALEQKQALDAQWRRMLEEPGGRSAGSTDDDDVR
jgi:hypothetical protein